MSLNNKFHKCSCGSNRFKQEVIVVFLNEDPSVPSSGPGTIYQTEIKYSCALCGKPLEVKNDG